MQDQALLQRAREAFAAEEYSEAVHALEAVQVERLSREELTQLRGLFSALPEEQRKASALHCLQEIQLAVLSGEYGDIQRWFNQIVSRRDGFKEGTPERRQADIYINYANLIRPKTDDAKLLLMLAVIFNESSDAKNVPIFISLTGKLPSIMHGRKDVSDWGLHYGAVTSIVKPMLVGRRRDDARGAVECARGELFYDRNELTAATLEIAGALSASDPEVLFAGYVQLARLHSLDPVAQSCENVLDHLGKLIEEKNADWLLPNYRAARVRFSLLTGDTERAKQWLGELEGSEWDGVVPDTYYELSTKARVYIALGRYREAASLLEQLLRSLENDVRPYDRVDCLAHAALACEKLGSAELAIAKLNEALHVAEPYGYIRVFADCGTEMLHLLMRYIKETSPQNGFGRFVGKAAEAAKGFSLRWPHYFTSSAVSEEVLPQVDFTVTETQILQLLGEGKSNGEIADELKVKLPTVKFHLKNVYEKLEVSSRTAALSAAKKRNML